ncbi:hypothetical protein KK062_29830 [Fulvivirgaceae bacterium PWU5]|uniref:Uncharacterized protein n=1 Tax=Dawidia cretensis TaxID=2782350 RepID=A0AAP2E5I7_9BACT|nr:hypothetical protein [Dawidia cretensis]MBT1712472.1 hypothetical protein [Dawidia cretensis]
MSSTIAALGNAIGACIILCVLVYYCIIWSFPLQAPVATLTQCRGLTHRGIFQIGLHISFLINRHTGAVSVAAGRYGTAVMRRGG